MSKQIIYNDILNPTIWNKDLSIRPEVYSKLLKIASDFYSDSELKAKLKDVLLLGSSANYNWTPTSDVDLHLVVDIKELGMDEDSAKNYLNALKSKWNYEHDITIKGQNVEGYIQDVGHKTHATGIYSLMKGTWLVKPIKEKVILDQDLIKSKYADYVYKINKVLSDPSIEKIKLIVGDIYKMREAGLDDKGEMSTENIVFKFLRNKGYIERLRDLKNKIYDKSMSLDEMPDITKKDDGIYAGSGKLKDLKFEDIKKNIVMFRVPDSENGFFPKGYTLVYFMDSEQSALDIKDGKIPYLMVPLGTFRSGGSPITDIWKKKFQKPGTEHILGHVQSLSSDEEIYIEFMTVRKEYRRNSINSSMIGLIKSNFPNAEIKYSSPTPDGTKFIKSNPISESNNESDLSGWLTPTGKLLKLQGSHEETLDINKAGVGKGDAISKGYTRIMDFSENMTFETRLDRFGVVRKFIRDNMKEPKNVEIEIFNNRGQYLKTVYYGKDGNLLE